MNTEAQARQVRTRFCKLAIDGRHVWTGFGGDLPDLYEAGHRIEEWLTTQTPPPPAPVEPASDDLATDLAELEFMTED